MLHRAVGLCILLSAIASQAVGQKLLIPMDKTQTDHLKAYGVAYWCLQKGIVVDWLLNYRGGSFLVDALPAVASELVVRGVRYEELTSAETTRILAEIESEDNNAAVMRLEKAPKIVVYVPPTNLPWDDAVTLVLTYAEIPFAKVWDEEVLRGDLKKYDWLHVHHEDFTGQYGKFFAGFRNAPWYIRQVRDAEQMARKLGFTKVSEEKKAVARAIRDFVGEGGFMFAMCSAPDSYDIALAAEGIDIVPAEFDGDGVTPDANKKLDFSKTFAFENFTVSLNPFEYSKSNIDINPQMTGSATGPENDYFTLFEFSAKFDPVPSMLTQNHTSIIKGFYGQTTSFRKSLIKSSVVIMGEKKGTEEVRYLHGNYGKGQFCFYGGHDPEDYQHHIGDPPTNLALHKNSAGYRLILNNVLFPAAQKKKQKT
ncbi:MAG: asparagine synthetase B [Chloroherpetonaceae bacterium]|nr:asparagine synthetase B [Chloroherpetonaceae bacterium]MCS7211105.1 asparagine synthetase B [Chloroherpetonaceae bacterium]MDW8019991.1 asparagine synthetase B [Chloroherpetonaceae bacterium]